MMIGQLVMISNYLIHNLLWSRLDLQPELPWQCTMKEANHRCNRKNPGLILKEPGSCCSTGLCSFLNPSDWHYIKP